MKSVRLAREKSACLNPFGLVYGYEAGERGQHCEVKEERPDAVDARRAPVVDHANQLEQDID